MNKHCRVSVIPRDPTDCNQLQSLVGHKVDLYYYPAFKVGQLSNVLLNIGGVVHVGTQMKAVDSDPVVSINELATQLRLWAII